MYSLLMKLLLVCTMMIPPLKLTVKDAGHTILVKPNQYIQVVLSTNISTGFDWYVADWSKSSLFRLKEKYFSDRIMPGIVGQQTNKWFTFQLKTAGQFDVEFIYKVRTFEPVRRLTYTFKVVADE